MPVLPSDPVDKRVREGSGPAEIPGAVATVCKEVEAVRHIKRLRDRRDYRARRVLQEWAVMPQRVQVGWRDPAPRTLADAAAAVGPAAMAPLTPTKVELWGPSWI